MSRLTSALKTLFRSEGHAIDKRDLWGRGEPYDDHGIHAGVSVTQEGAQALTVVYRCISIVAETLGAMPWGAYREVGEAAIAVDRPARWLDSPNPETTPYEFQERIAESLAADGNTFILIAARDSLGYPLELWTLHPRMVEVRSEGGKTVYLWSDGSGASPIPLRRFTALDPFGDVLHIRLRANGGARGISPLEAARQAVGLAIVTEKTGARFFGKGAQLQGAIQLPAANSPSMAKEYVELIRETWKERHSGSDRAFDNPAILSGGATWANITATPEQAQFLETRRFQVEELCRLYGVPPHMVGAVDRSTSWGSGIEQQALGFLRFTLLPWIVRIEQAMSLLLPRGQYVKLNQRALLRGDSSTEAEVASKLLANGVVNFDHVRGWYELPSRPGGDRYMMPASQKLLEPDGTEAPVQVSPSPEREPVQGGPDQGGSP